MGVNARFLGVAIGEYRDRDWDRLPKAVPQVQEMRDLLARSAGGALLADASEEEIRSFLRSARNTATGGSLFAIWAGHAESEGGTLWLRGSDSGDLEGIQIEDVARMCMSSGASQVLLVVDTCYSGTATDAAIRAATAALAARPPAGHVWVGVLASCLPTETAVDGEFGERLLRLLREGPRNSGWRSPWAVHNEYLTGEHIGNALLSDWDSSLQKPTFRRDGTAWWLVQNPFYEPGAPPSVVQHLLQAARGGGSGQRSWFTGRTEEVDRVVGWVSSGSPGVRVVTGAAGTGKSAIVGRVVSLADPDERARLDDQGELGHSDPGVDSIDAHVHARGRTPDQVANELDSQLVKSGLWPREAFGWRNAFGLAGIVQQYAEHERRFPVLVIDGLDEARDESFEIARRLISPLAAWAIVVVSTRDSPESGDNPRSTLVGALGPTEKLDLDDRRWVESEHRAEVAYLEARLDGLDPRMDAKAVAEYVGTVLRKCPQQPFLLARVIADQLTARPVDTRQPEWESEVPNSVSAALQVDLSRVGEPPSRDSQVGDLET